MDTNKLKELAERAHKLGRWYWNPTVDVYPDMAVDQDFMLAANPQAILGLIERLEKAEQHWANENRNNMALIAEVERLRSAIQAVHAEIDGNIRPLTRDLVNMVSGLKNGSHPNDIYDHCDEIDRIIDAALEGGGR